MNARVKWILGLLVIVVAAWLLWPDRPQQTSEAADQAMTQQSESEHSGVGLHRLRARRTLTPEEAASTGLPQGAFEYVFDKAPHANKFLLSKGRDDKFRPHSDAPSGMDLWFQDASGNDRLIHGSVTRAKFSPDGSKVAFTTSAGDLHIEDLERGPMATIAGVYGPSWKPDGSTVIYSKVGEGEDPHRPGTRRLSTLNLETGETKNLTEGKFDDGLPEFGPSSDWVIFVSGSRTGLASFWKVPANGGEPVQLTNVGAKEVNENFVPPPYDKRMWSADKRWFVYDYKSGDREETWGLEFNPDGTLKQAAKLADGINPRLQGDGKTFVCERTTDAGIQTIVSNLP